MPLWVREWRPGSRAADVHILVTTLFIFYRRGGRASFYGFTFTALHAALVVYPPDFLDVRQFAE